MKKKKVLVVVRSLKIGGMEKVAINLCDALAELGHEAHLLSFKKSSSAIVPSNSNVHLHQIDIDRINRLTGIGFLYDLLIRIPLNLLIRKSGFIWRGYYTAPIFRWYLRVLENRYGKFDKIIVRGQGTFENLWRIHDQRVIICLENVINLNPETWKGRFFASALYHGKNIVCVSNGVQDNFISFAKKVGITAAKLNVISNPMPIEQIRTLAQEGEQNIPVEPYIINVARLVPQKNHRLLLKAYAQSGISEQLVIVGSGPLKSELECFAKELGIEQRVTFTGELLNPYPWMKHARLFVLSSKIEGLGIVLIESLACGTAVVSVDCPGGIRDVLVDEQKEFISEMTEQALAKMIQKGVSRSLPIQEKWLTKFEAKSIASAFII
ncbi:MAG: glycosyltransferase [Gammaproteobacteria bacterium]|nr:glycosyltransferase [Gammaproteobacteria bacterium]